MHWLVYVIMAVFALMVLSMFVITFKNIAESRRTQKLYEKIISLSKRQEELLHKVDRVLQEKEREG